MIMKKGVGKPTPFFLLIVYPKKDKLFIEVTTKQFDYLSNFGASTGQTPAQAPHSVQSSGLIT